MTLCGSVLQYRHTLYGWPATSIGVPMLNVCIHTSILVIISSSLAHPLINFNYTIIYWKKKPDQQSYSTDQSERPLECCLPPVLTVNSAYFIGLLCLCMAPPSPMGSNQKDLIQSSQKSFLCARFSIFVNVKKSF